MTLRRMQVTDFRCLHQAQIEFDEQFTLISGPNASGKTSLLEAIYVLGRGRSFRTRNLRRLIRGGAERLLVSGEMATEGPRVSLGLEASSEGIRGRINGSRIDSLAELALSLPVQVIDPEGHRLIEEGPGHRRRFLDWGVFHVEHSFIRTWQQFQRVLKQRNAALRAGQARDLVAAWDGELVRQGVALGDSRLRYLAMLAPIAEAMVGRLLQLPLSLAYRPGWPRELSFPEALERSWPQDQQLKATQVGPQRAELGVRLDGVAARDRISRGQQKLLAACLLLAQMHLFRAEAGVRPLLLLDDPAAELDRAHLEALVAEVRSLTLQRVMTTLADESGELESFGVPGRRYRLGNGVLSPV